MHVLKLGWMYLQGIGTLPVLNWEPGRGFMVGAPVPDQLHLSTKHKRSCVATSCDTAKGTEPPRAVSPPPLRCCRRHTCCTWTTSNAYPDQQPSNALFPYSL